MPEIDDIDIELLLSGESTARVCHVCDHRHELDAPEGTDPMDLGVEHRPRVCPRCGARQRFSPRRRRELERPFTLAEAAALLYTMYGFGEGLRTIPRLETAAGRLFNLALTADHVRRAVAFTLTIDIEVFSREALRSYEMSDPTPEARAQAQRAIELLRQDARAGLLGWRLRDLGDQVIAELEHEREHQLELLRRRQAAGLR